MNDTPTNSPKRRLGGRIIFWLACLALLAVFVGLVLNRSSKKEWEAYKRQWEARGERFDLASFVPPAVPDDRNFALAPVVAGSYAKYLDKNGHKISPPNTNIVDRLSLELRGDSRLVEWPTNSSGNWRKGTATALQVSQNYYRALAAKTNLFPLPLLPQSAAADVLSALGKYDSTIEELRLAARRPDSRFPLNYDADPPFLILLPHLTPLKHCAEALQLRAIAELQNHQSDQALADIRLSFRLMDAIRTEPTLISHLVRMAMVNIALQPVWEGLAEHQWTDAQLVELDREFTRLDFLADYKFSMRAERASSIATVDYLRRKRNFQGLLNVDGDISGDHQEDPFLPITVAAFRLIPGSVFYKNELAIARMHQQHFLPIVDGERRIASPAAARRAGEAVEQMRKHWSPNNLLACLLLPSLESAVKKYIYSQSLVDLARVAFALERYRLAQGEYPASLDALAPPFIEKIPHDIVSGQPLRYCRTNSLPAQGAGTPGGTFLLYSVGWNETDDGGAVVSNEHGTIVREKGDWVWPGTVERSE
jgi:hypothetical protein